MQGSFLWKFLIKISSLSNTRSKSKGLAGFTLIELLVVIAIAGILAAIAAPAWLTFVNRQKLGSSQNSAYTAIRSAQSNAKRDKRTWQVSFRNNPTANKAQWVVYPARALTVSEWNALPWQDFDPIIRIDTTVSSLIALPTINYAPGLDDYFAQFNAKGEPNVTQTVTVPRQITLTTIPTAGTRKVCVEISTLLGSLSSKSDGDCD
jgi:prepilin-type N-terminal cleavage/methylation domain-containing protein